MASGGGGALPWTIHKPIIGLAEPEAIIMSVLSHQAGSTTGMGTANPRAQALANRLERGAEALATLAASLTDAEWQTPLPHDGRTIGVVVHHVGSVYPIEIQLAQTLADGKKVSGVTMADVHAMNANHAKENAGVTREAAIDLLRRNSAAAAVAIRALGDEQLERAAEASLYDDAPITCQFMLEDHAVRHSYHHLAGIKAALKR
jgi:Mycothiol maleylpyruvate isomerase N-terminal domain